MVGKKKKKKPAPAPASPIGGAMAAGIAAMRESLRNPETQAKIAQGFAKLKPQVDALKAEMGQKPTEKRVETDTGIPSVEGLLRLPDKFVPRAGRHDFYWICNYPHTDKWDNSCAVKASYWREDSVSTQDIIDQRPGARKGDWTVDVIGYNGGAMFRLAPDHAKRVAEAILSAVGFETEWRKHFAEHGHSTVEGGEMSEIPHADPGPAVPSAREWLAERGFTPSEPYQDIPTVVPVENPDNSQSIPGGGTSEGPSFEEYMAKGGDNPMDSLAGFGDSEAPPAAPAEDEVTVPQHACCGHCDPFNDVHAPHSKGCPSGFDKPRVIKDIPQG